MKLRKRTVSLLLALCMMFSLAAPVFAVGVEEKITAVVRFADGTDADALCAALEALPGVSVRWTYEALFRGAAIEGSESALAAAAECGGVAAVYRSRLWAQPCAEGDPAGTSNSLDVMRGEDIAYNGDGMVVAVIDSGLYVSHEAFQDYGIMENPTLSEEDIEDFVDEGGTDGRYISQKVPFAYDYSGDDRSVHTADSHGTHVTALAVGYSENEDGSRKFSGVAPAAQLLCMKVFPDAADRGADDADVLKAMEDAFLLGADVLNLSLGTEGDFMEGSAVGELYKTAIEKIRGAGVIVCCAAGNSGDALTGKQGAVTYPTADFTDYGTAAIPAAYPGATSVGAVNALTSEGGGGIVVNGVTIGFVKGVSENEEEVLPDLDSLANRELTYVMVGGLGKKEDFEGLDLTGCVAVVKRGEIYFSEKVQNAAERGAVACLVYNNEAGAIRPAVTGTTIPSALITQAAGAYLAENAENGRGTMTVKPDVVMVSMGAQLSIMEGSSWGATTDLRLLPLLSAPGGSILSAIPGKKDAYGYLSGTSMATPNASGSFAVVMQALAERGITDRKARADAVESLLMSTAALVTDEDGTPLSPRRQGAGVIDLTAALRSRAVIVDPVLELGDGIGNAFALSFVVKNTSEEDLVFSVDTSVLTDAIGLMGGQTYTTLTPIEITKYMKISGADDVTVAAGGQQTVRLNIAIDSALTETLEEAYPNGFFLEGYVTLTEKSGEKIHATFMGYRGDWEAAPVIEQADFRDVMDAIAETEGSLDDLSVALGVNMWYNLVYLKGGTAGNEQMLMAGENPYAEVKANDERIAMSTVTSDAHAMAGYGFDIDLYPLRNAAHVIMVVSDRKTGAIYYVDDTENLPRADFDSTTGLVQNSGWFCWDGTDASGKPLADGTVVDVEFFAWTESDKAMQSVYAGRKSDMTRPETYRWLIGGLYDGRKEWSFPLTLDGTAPTVETKWNETTGEAVLTVNEEEFLAYAKVRSGSGEVIFEESYDGTVRGESHVLTVTVPAGENILYVMLADYASNTIGYRIELNLEQDDVTRCAMAVFSDVRMSAWYHDAVDCAYENGWMDAADGLAFEPDHGAMRATVVEALYRLAGEPDVTDVELPFTDLVGNEDFIDALKWAYREGIATGYTDTMFAGLASVRRQQLAVMLYRAAKLAGEVTEYDESVLDSFADGAEVSGWAREAMSWAVGEGIISGDSEGKLNPGAVATRAQLARILMNINKEN